MKTAKTFTQMTAIISKDYHKLNGAIDAREIGALWFAATGDGFEYNGYTVKLLRNGTWQISKGQVARFSWDHEFLGDERPPVKFFNLTTENGEALNIFGDIDRVGDARKHAKQYCKKNGMDFVDDGGDVVGYRSDMAEYWRLNKE